MYDERLWVSSKSRELSVNRERDINSHKRSVELVVMIGEHAEWEESSICRELYHRN